MRPDPQVRRVAVPGMPEPPNASWSNCLRIGDEIVISGVTARGADGLPIGGDSMELQAAAILERIATMVVAAGGNVGSIYKLVIYVTDMTRKDDVNKVRSAFFKPAYPCSTLVEVKGFAFPGLLIEIDAFANAGVDLQAAARG